MANAQSRNVSVKSFSSVGVRSGIDLYLTQGATESLTIHGENDIIKEVIVEQENDRLTIRYKDGIKWSSAFKNRSVKVYLTFKTLKGISANGGSDVYGQSTINTESLTVSANGGSDVSLTLTCKDLQVSANGGSDVKLKGSGENMVVSANGGSDFDAFGYVVNYAKISVNGGSDANVNVNKGLEASANGGSDVSYKGNAVLKKTSNSKSSDITHVR